MSDPQLTLVVPCYNEAGRLDLGAYHNALGAMPWLDLLFVDDGSSDATRRLLEAFCTEHQGRSALRVLAKNQGKGEAVRIGLVEATGRAPICGFWDADLSAPLSELEALRRTLLERPDLDWVWGIRLKSLGRRVERRPSRHYLGRLFATVSGTVLNTQAYDTQCGAKVFRSSPELRDILATPFVSRWIFDVELLLRGTRLRLARGQRQVTVMEQPLHTWHHREGSKLGPKDFVVAVTDLLALRRACTTARESE